MLMQEIRGTSEVGVMKRVSDSQYVCWNNDARRWYLSSNVNEAHRILGDKELNFERISEMYARMTGDKTALKMELKTYVYHADSRKSCFAETLQMNVAVLYDYVQH
jgi:hypothetical protein